MGYTREEILRITQPSDLFPRDEEGVKKKYRALIKEWHPDVYRGDKEDANRVTEHLTMLYGRALRQLSEGVWGYKRQETVRVGDKGVRFNYNHSFDFELGRALIGNTSLLFKVNDPKNKFVPAFLNTVKHFNFADAAMEDEFSRYLPVLKESYADEGVFVLRKTEDVHCLRDVLAAAGGTLDSRHVAWILSSLYNLACYLHFSKLTHNGINLDNVYISPKYHSAMLLGGWWYAVPQGEPYLGMPMNVFDLLSPKAKVDKIAHYELDLASIRKIGRDLLGGLVSGSPRPAGVPDALYNWLTGGKYHTPFEEYKKWNEVLDASWGKRRFVVLDIDMDMYYSNQTTKGV